jgi:hypothetical protein
MGSDFCDFEFTVGSDRDRDLPGYITDKNPYAGRAFRSAIEAAYGPLPEAMALAEAFIAVRPTIVQAAAKKVIALEGEIDQPVPIAGPDIYG